MPDRNTQAVTPELADVVNDLVDKTLIGMNICLPAKIVSYDKATQYATVQVQLKQKRNGVLVNRPPIPNVPVKHPRANGGKAFIHMPLKTGDDVTLVFSQRSLDNWKTQGGMQDPADPRKFNFTDAYALIGGSSIPDAFSPTTDDSIEIVNGSSSLVVTPDGKFQLKNDTAELVQVLQKVVQTLSTASTLAGGPFTPDVVADLTEAAQQLQTLEKS